MKTVVLTGIDSEVDKVIKENRLRVQRGCIKFIPENLNESDGQVIESNGKENIKADVPKRGKKPSLSKDSKKVQMEGKADIEV
jgi:hypothetical protein